MTVLGPLRRADPGFNPLLGPFERRGHQGSGLSTQFSSSARRLLSKKAEEPQLPLLFPGSVSPARLIS